MHSIAIKINVSQKDQEAINQMLEIAGYAHQKRKFHCTFGFIEKAIPELESSAFGQRVTQLLQEMLAFQPLLFEVGKSAHLFGHVIAFLPTAKSSLQLKKINIWLFDKVKEVSEGRWGLNEETFAPNYIPHLTLLRARRLDYRFKKLEELFAKSPPSFRLSEAAYVIFNQ